MKNENIHASLTGKEIAVLKYMDIRIKGIGTGLSEKEIGILNNISDVEWEGISLAIKRLRER